MTTGLTRGAYSGRETKLYYNSASHDAPTLVEITRARNITTTDGPSLSEIEFHGATSTGNISGYDKFSGSFEYVKKRGTDTVFSALETIRKNRDIVELQFMNDAVGNTGATGWKAPVLLGEFSESSNGGDGVVVTVPFAKADSFDSAGDSVELSYPTTA